MKTLIQNLFLALGLLALPALVKAQLTFTTNSGVITSTGYNTAGGLNVVIPAATNGYFVTGIGADAFSGRGITGVGVVEACANLSHPIWPPVATNTFSGSGASAFNDLQSPGYPVRFYRKRSP